MASRASPICERSDVARSDSTLRRSVAEPSSTFTSSSFCLELSRARARSTLAEVSRLGRSRLENSSCNETACSTPCCATAIPSRAVSATRSRRALSASSASTCTLSRPSFSACDASSASFFFSSARARAVCSLALVSRALAELSSALSLSMVVFT